MGGWTAIGNDALAFLAAIRWDRPSWLWLVVVPVVLAAIEWFLRRRGRAAVARIGPAIAVEALSRDRPPRPRTARFTHSLAWSCLAIGIAGPRWGDGDADGVAVGRDFACCIDLSRSMLADDGADAKARWQVAVEAAGELIDGLRSRGGHRVSVTVFAARATTLVPLTTDYDHAKSKLAELNGRFPPPTIRPDRDDFPSGTRIGTGVTAAIGTFDSRTGRTRDVLLFTDGDDPAGDDEWRGGLAAARRADVPVHVVGIGDPNQSSLIPLGREVLEFTGPDDRRDVVRTTLNESPLMTIAAESRGQYLAARRQRPAWTPFLRDVVDGGATRELAEWQLPQKRSRTAWFYLTAAALFAMGWLLNVRGVVSRTASAVG